MDELLGANTSPNRELAKAHVLCPFFLRCVAVALHCGLVLLLQLLAGCRLLACGACVGCLSSCTCVCVCWCSLGCVCGGCDSDCVDGLDISIGPKEERHGEEKRKHMVWQFNARLQYKSGLLFRIYCTTLQDFAPPKN